MLVKLGLWERFEADGHPHCYARRSVWGAPEPVELDGLIDPDGFGWRLDRRRFERSLRLSAQEKGAILLAPARPATVERDAGGWRISLDDGREVETRLLIDAAGRSSRLLRRFGARRRAADRLICAWTHAPLRREAAEITYTESEPDGWWYSAPLPGGRRILAFHTDADLPAAQMLRDDRLVRRALARPALSRELGDCDLSAAAPARLCAAHGARLGTVAGDGWFAAGDAATAFDPLSSQGLFNALYTGMAAAEAAGKALAGEEAAAAGYAGRLDEIWAAYERRLALFYGAERRWPGSPFWARRFSLTAVPHASADDRP